MHQVARALVGVLAVAGSPALSAGAGPAESRALALTGIPRDYQEALQRLQATLPAQQLEAIRAGNTSAAWWDRSIGAQILKDWVEPPGSALTAYFRRLGIDHPRDISPILQHCFYLYLNHRLAPRDLQMEISFREGYWERLLTQDKAAAAESLSRQAAQNPALMQKAYEQDANLVTHDLLDTLNHPTLSVPLELQAWKLMDEWVLQQTANLTAADAGDYVKVVTALDPTIRVDATDLQARTTLLSIDQGQIGRVMVVTTQAGRPPLLWRIDARLPGHGPDAAQLRCWRPAAGVRPCAPQIIGSLPPDAQGMPRFYVQAVYAQSAGAIQASQLSVWLWNGRTASPIYVTSYITGGDADGQGVSIEGDTLRIGTKSRFRALLSCGSCDGRQLAHQLRLLPDNHVVDLGTTSLTPELDLIDRVYSDIRDGRPSGAWISASALSVMNRSWAPMLGGKLRSLFINTPPSVAHEGARTLVCFHANYDFDRPMPPILFTMESQGAHLRLLRAQQDAPGCHGKPTAGAS